MPIGHNFQNFCVFLSLIKHSFFHFFMPHCSVGGCPKGCFSKNMTTVQTLVDIDAILLHIIAKFGNRSYNEELKQEFDLFVDRVILCIQKSCSPAQYSLYENQMKNTFCRITRDPREILLLLNQLENQKYFREYAIPTFLVNESMDEFWTAFRKLRLQYRIKPETDTEEENDNNDDEISLWLDRTMWGLGGLVLGFFFAKYV